MGRFWSNDSDVRDTRVFITDGGKLVATVNARLDFGDPKAVGAWKAAQVARLRLVYKGGIVFDFRDSAGRITIRQEAA
jgi:hypothetical protein